MLDYFMDTKKEVITVQKVASIVISYQYNYVLRHDTGGETSSKLRKVS
jgi:hypothetical protein